MESNLNSSFCQERLPADHPALRVFSQADPADRNPPSDAEIYKKQLSGYHFKENGRKWQNASFAKSSAERFLPE